MDDFDGTQTAILDRRYFQGAKGVIGIRNGLIAGAVAWILLLAALVIAA
jgi:hypothetical protein